MHFKDQDKTGLFYSVQLMRIRKFIVICSMLSEALESRPRIAVPSR